MAGPIHHKFDFLSVYIDGSCEWILGAFDLKIYFCAPNPVQPPELQESARRRRKSEGGRMFDLMSSAWTSLSLGLLPQSAVLHLLVIKARKVSSF